MTMRAHEGYQEDYRVAAPYIAVMMMVNAVIPFPLLVLVTITIDLGSGMGSLACLVIWIVLSVTLGILGLFMAVRKEMMAAVMGMFLAWPVALYFPIFGWSIFYYYIASIPPGILTLMVIWMLRLIYLIERTRPPPVVPEYPLSR